MRIMSAFRPDIASFGYATFLSISATSIWGGIFPYLPASSQTSFVTIVFYSVQISAFWLTFFIAMAFAWRYPKLTNKSNILLHSLPLITGPLILIGSMYLKTGFIILFCIAAILIGFGSALFLLSWQRIFAASDSKAGNLALIKGTGYSALIYFCIAVIPSALTAYILPLVLVPLAGLCLWLANRTISFDQPMFEDVPRSHTVVYHNAVKESTLPAVLIGALGFCSGAIRFIAVTHQEIMSTINIFSMFSLLGVVIVFYVVWRRHTLHINLMTLFAVLYTVVATCLIILPFAGLVFTDIGIAISYACFMLATVLMMMHCGQISRDSGINPVFIFAFFGTIAYFLQMCGYLVGYGSGSGIVLGVEQLSLVSLVSLYIMLLIAIMVRRVGKLRTHRLEFLMLTPQKTRDHTSAEIAVTQEVRAHASAKPKSLKSVSDAAKDRLQTPRVPDLYALEEKLMPKPLNLKEDAPILDRLSKQCQSLKELYGLSSREAEVMELIARGYSGPAISEILFISENTMRTHNKRIYTKLGIHKKQELLVMIEHM